MISLKMPNYQATKIYKLVCLNDEIKDIYVGSTSVKLNRRFSHHKHYLTKKPNKKLSKFITKNGGIENWKIELIEDYPCNTKDERLWRERHWCDILNSSLNFYRPITTEEENKERMKKNSNIYMSNPVNKERQKELDTIRRNNRTQEEIDEYNAKRKETRNRKKREINKLQTRELRAKKKNKNIIL